MSEISLPDPSINLTTAVEANAGDTLSKMLHLAKLKRQEADNKLDNLVEVMVNKFSQMASVVSRLKMEGQINTPVAKQLAKSIPEGMSVAIDSGVEKPRVEIERNQLDKLMSVEQHLSPVHKRVPVVQSKLTKKEAESKEESKDVQI